MDDQNIRRINKTKTLNKHGSGTGFRLLLATLLNFGISVIQVIGGLFSNSLSLLSDALHNFGDTISLSISYFATRISQNDPDFRKTFGYKRIEILAAFFNGLVLIAICVYLFFEAYGRLNDPQPVKSRIMIPVAVFGLLMNLVSMLLVYGKQKESLNVRAAFIHLLADSLSSVAVIIGAILMWLFGLYWIDPLVTFLVGIYIIYRAWLVIRETVDILMQASPVEIDINQVRKLIEDTDEIENIHHVHIWRLNDTDIHFEAHIMLTRDLTMKQMMVCKSRIEELLRSQFGIAHTTLQFEYEECGDRGLIATKPN